jgi:hypothetical protein
MKDLTSEGLQLILDWEVGGGQKYYDKFCTRPVVPGGRDTVSGITIGIGWDVGAHGHGDLSEQWGEFLAPGDLAKLMTVVGCHGDAAKKFLPAMSSICVPWSMALAQFQKYTVPAYVKMTGTAFPGVETAPVCVLEALVSLVFNRGDSVSGTRRVEMANIRGEVAKGKWSAIPAELRAMKRLWPDTKNLCERREAEAVHIEKGLAT